MFNLTLKKIFGIIKIKKGEKIMKCKDCPWLEKIPFPFCKIFSARLKDVNKKCLIARKIKEYGEKKNG